MHSSMTSPISSIPFDNHSLPQYTACNLCSKHAKLFDIPLVCHVSFSMKYPPFYLCLFLELFFIIQDDVQQCAVNAFLLSFSRWDAETHPLFGTTNVHIGMSYPFTQGIKRFLCICTTKQWTIWGWRLIIIAPPIDWDMTNTQKNDCLINGLKMNKR